MTRRKNPLAAEKEAQLQLAITAVLNKEHTCHSAAIAFAVPRRTLYYRVKENRKPRNQAHESEQILTHAEKKSWYDGLHSLQSPDTPHGTKHCDGWRK